MKPYKSESPYSTPAEPHLVPTHIALNKITSNNNKIKNGIPAHTPSKKKHGTTNSEVATILTPYSTATTLFPTSNIYSYSSPNLGPMGKLNVNIICDIPLINVTLYPHIVIGSTLITKDIVLKDEKIVFNWYRGKKLYCICNKPAILQCLHCVKQSNIYGNVNDTESFYCSMLCYSNNFIKHNKTHIKLDNNLLPEFNYDEEIDSSLFSKYPSRRLETWASIANTLNYTPTTADIGCLLKLRVTCDNKYEEIELHHVRDHPDTISNRKWKHSVPRLIGNPSRTLRVCCYNTLADIYASKTLYPYCPSWALQWPYRSLSLSNEILSYNSDILCVQEVTVEAWEYFKPILAVKGMDGLFKLKTREPPTDGCAIFFSKRFQLKEEWTIEFNEAARVTSETLQNVDKKATLRRLCKGNIALVAQFYDTQSFASFIVVNTHLYWDSQFEDVKLWQTLVLVNELEKLSYDHSLPLILCGDFNSLPDSAVYAYLTNTLKTPYMNSSSNFNATVAANIEKVYELDALGILPNLNALGNGLALASSYNSVSSEPPYTNYTGHFTGVLDYIFYSRSTMKVNSVLEIDDEEKIKKMTALPSPWYPSDHIAILAELEFL